MPIQNDNLEDYFLGLKVFNFHNYICFLASEMCNLEVTTGEKPPNKSAFKVKNVKSHIALKYLIRQSFYK